MGYYSEVAIYITADNIQALIDEFNAAVPEAGTDFADFVDNYSKYLQVSADEFLFYADYVKWYTWGSHNGFPIVSGPNGAQWLESFVDWVREAHPESSGAFVRIGTYKRDVSAHSWGPEGAGTIQLVQEIKFNEDLTSRFLSGDGSESVDSGPEQYDYDREDRLFGRI